MKLALTKFSWIEDPPPPTEPPIRACVIVGDAPPHPGEGTLCVDLAKRGLAAGVRFYGIIARESEKNLKEADSEGAAPKPPAGTRPADIEETGDADDATKDDAPPSENGHGRGGDGADDTTPDDDPPGRGRRTPERQIAPPKPPPPVAAKERSYTWFPEIAEAGGGRAEILKAQDSLVAEIAELTIADRYRDEFADFFAAFRLLCK